MGEVLRAAELFREASGNPAAARAALLQGLSDSDVLVRHVAAVQLAKHFPVQVPEPAIREMVETLLGEPRRLQGEPPIYREYSEATVSEESCHDLGQDLALALARLPAGSADFAVPALVALWQGDRQFYEAVLAAICLAFPERGDRPPASALSDVQQGVLQALLEDAAVWLFCGDTAPLLAARGMPDTPTSMREYLGN